MKKIIILIGLVIFTLSISANGENDGKTKKASTELKGQVIDSKSGEALVGVAVKFNNDTYYTDFEGEFKIENIVPGQYTLETSYVAYQNKQINVSFTENNESLQILLTEN